MLIGNSAPSAPRAIRQLWPWQPRPIRCVDVIFAVMARIQPGLTCAEDLIKALDKPDGLFGAALDVTDPEPLPPKHPLFTHPKVIVTPHQSGNTEGEMDIATQICLENLKRIEKGDKVVNEVDFTRGY